VLRPPESEDDVSAKDVWEYNWENTAPGGNMYNTLVEVYKKVDNMAQDVWEYNWQETAPGGNMYNAIVSMNMQIAALSEAVKELAKSKGANPDKIAKAVDDAVKARLEKIKLNVKAS
jgi:pyruvate-formate lyase